MASACNAAFFDFVFCHDGSLVSSLSIIVDVVVFVEDINNAWACHEMASLTSYLSLADLGVTASMSFSAHVRNGDVHIDTISHD